MRPGTSAIVTAAYVLVAVAFCFVPGIGVEWFAAPRDRVVVGGILTAVVLGAVHLVRHRWPVATVAAVLGVLVVEAVATGTTSIGALLIACDALYTLVITRTTPRGQRALPSVAVACLSLAVAGLLFANLLPSPILQATIILLAVGVTLWWGVSVRMPMTRADQERERAALVAEAAEAQQREAVTAQRLQISRELHDTVSGHLSAIAMQSAAAVAAADSLTPAELTARLGHVRSLSLDAMSDMRSMIEVLRSEGESPTRSQPNWSRIDALLAEAASSGGGLARTGDDPAGARLSPLVSVAAYNVVRECLVNAAKHAPGCPVAVDLRCGSDLLLVTVVNGLPAPGGADAATGDVGAPRSGFGLRGLAERVRLCGGAIEVEPGPDAWTVRAELPQLSRMPPVPPASSVSSVPPVPPREGAHA